MSQQQQQGCLNIVEDQEEDEKLQQTSWIIDNGCTNYWGKIPNYCFVDNQTFK